MLAPLIRRALRTVHLVAAQSRDDARRFVALGAAPEHVEVTGNLKFDMAPVQADAFVQAFAAARGTDTPVWIAASTHEGEEAAMLDAHRALRRSHPEALLLWAPRHPERFRAVVQQAREAGFRVATRSEDSWPSASTDVFVIDTLGELLRFYACAQVAFVGGSFQPIGGHNLLEPAATGTAILTGPYLHNFADISRRLREADAMRVASDPAALARELQELFDDANARAQMCAHATELLEAGRGALERTLQLIAPKLPAAPAAGISGSAAPG